METLLPQTLRDWNFKHENINLYFPGTSHPRDPCNIPATCSVWETTCPACPGPHCIFNSEALLFLTWALLLPLHVVPAWASAPLTTQNRELRLWSGKLGAPFLHQVCLYALVFVISLGSASSIPKPSLEENNQLEAPVAH